MPDFGEAPWEHRLEEPREKRRRGQRAACQLSGATGTKPERDTTVGERLQAIVGDGDAEDVAAEVFEDLLPGARFLRVDDPVAGPGAGRDLIGQVGLVEGVVHLPAKDG